MLNQNTSDKELKIIIKEARNKSITTEPKPMVTQKFTDDGYLIIKIVQIFGIRRRALVFSVIDVCVRRVFGFLISNSAHKKNVACIFDRWMNFCYYNVIQTGNNCLNSLSLHIVDIYFDNEMKLKKAVATVTPLGNLRIIKTRLLEG